MWVGGLLGKLEKGRTVGGFCNSPGEKVHLSKESDYFRGFGGIKQLRFKSKNASINLS